MTASMILCRSAIRGMMKARWGRITLQFPLSLASPETPQTNYAASKAMIGFSKSLAYEVASSTIKM